MRNHADSSRDPKKSPNVKEVTYRSRNHSKGPPAELPGGGGGFKDVFLLHPNFLGEMIHFNEQILSNGLVKNHQLDLFTFVLVILLMVQKSGGHLLRER